MIEIKKIVFNFAVCKRFFDFEAVWCLIAYFANSYR